MNAMPATVQSSATTLPRWTRSFRANQPNKKTQTVLVYCKNAAAAADVRVNPITNNVFIAVNVAAETSNPGRQRTRCHFTSGNNAIEANSAR